MTVKKTIKFNDDMLLKIIERKKTQTRRRVKFEKGLPIGDVDDWYNKEPNADWKGFGDGFYYDSRSGSRVWMMPPYEEHTAVLIQEDYAYYKGSLIYKLDNPDLKVNWRSKIYMKREECRFQIIIKKVRIQRLKDITTRDAMREGVSPVRGSYIEGFMEAIGDIYKDIRLNSYVWVYDFKF